jgi:hypothetical protein
MMRFRKICDHHWHEKFNIITEKCGAQRQSCTYYCCNCTLLALTVSEAVYWRIYREKKMASYLAEAKARAARTGWFKAFWEEFRGLFGRGL